MYDPNQDQVFVHPGLDSNTVSGFGTRERKQCHAFVRPAVGTNTGHLMSGSQGGLFEIKPLPVFKV